MNTYRVSGLFCRRFCFSRFFGKCAHSASKALTVFLAVLLIFSFFSFSVSAEDLNAGDFSVLLGRETPNSTGGVTTDYYTFTTSSFSSNGINCNFYQPQNYADFWAKGAVKIMSAFDAPKMIAGHEYQLTFATGVNFNAKTVIKVFLGSQKIYENSVSGTGAKEVSVNLTAPEVVTNSEQVRIECSVSGDYGYGSAGQEAGFLLSKEIGWNDNTDNPGWLGKILQKFTDLGDRISGFFSNLAESIGSFFSSLGDRISGFFTDLWNNIKAKFDDLKQWFQDLGDRIQGFFVDLYNDIVDGLKKLFIPSDGYFESKKTELETFCTEHFGALYQAPTILVDFIRKFTTISPQEPAITLPAIEFNFQGKHYQLTEAYTYSFSWVNDSSHMLYYLYRFFRGFVTVVLFISFANYCKNKYYDVFKGGSSE